MKSWENKPLLPHEKEEIIKKAEKLFAEILKLYGWDIENDPNMIETPKRIAKSWFEIFRGSFDPKPNIKNFPISEMDYNLPQSGPMIQTQPGSVFVGPIKIYSMCSHHFLPIIGYAYVEYKFNEKVVGLSKIPRIVDWVARRPAIQEKLTQQIVEEVQKITESPAVYAYVEAKHLCTCMRGAEEDNALMCTEHYIGYTKEDLDAVRCKISNVKKDIVI